MMIPARHLVRSDRGASSDDDSAPHFRLLVSDTSLSFWGGIDPVTAKVVDQTHPLVGETVTNTILCLPSGRGSCTASQVLLELILNDLAPRAIVLRDIDGLACVGAIIAAEIFSKRDLDIICVGEEGYSKLLQSQEAVGMILADGSLALGSSSGAEHSLATSMNDASDDHDTSSTFVLNQQEEQLLQRSATVAERMALHVITQYAHLLANTQQQRPVSYIPIENAHIDGCTYIGPGGLEFVRRLVEAGGKVRVPTTLNAVSTDRQQWQALQVPAERAMASIELGDAYLELGCQPSFTCAPYLLPNAPSLGQDIAWGESNAVVYSNSMLGARTEKLADYLDICCAIAGIVPAIGIHLPENRQPQVLLDASKVLSDLVGSEHVEGLDLLYPILGHLCGSLSDGKVPLLLGLESMAELVTLDHMKAFCAAFGTTGSSPLIHVAGITPEATDKATIDNLIKACSTRRTITDQDIIATFQTLDSDVGIEDDIALVALGNPHLSFSECGALSEMIALHGGKKDSGTRIVACLSRVVHEKAQVAGFIPIMQSFGVEFVNDTCWCMLLDAPLIPSDAKAKILSNSGKYAHYGPGLTGRAFRFGSMQDCVQAAATGVYARKLLGSNASSLFPSLQRRIISSDARLLLRKMLTRIR